jgi:hypothetical protein
MSGLQRRAALGLLLAPLAPAVRAQGERVLRFAWWGGGSRHAATLKALRLFEQRHPGVRVKAEYMGFNGYLERLTTQIAGRSEPDLMQINWAWMAMFSKRGTGFADLRPHRALLPLDQFSPATWPGPRGRQAQCDAGVLHRARAAVERRRLRPRRPGAAETAGTNCSPPARPSAPASATTPTRSTASSTT